MLELHDLSGRRLGAYRAKFNGTDLGATAAAPVIQLENREIPLAVFAGGTAASFGRVRLAGDPVWLITLTFTAVPEVLTAVTAAGTLTLTPVAGSASGVWTFTAARLLPGWEIRLPDREVHTITVHFRADSAEMQI